MSTQYFRFSAPQEFEAGRCALLEKLLACANQQVITNDWRRDAFQVLAQAGAVMPALAPAVLCAENLAPDAGWVCMATPLHYLADSSSVRLPWDGVLPLDGTAAESLALDFNRVWKNSGVGLIAGRTGHLYCAFERAPSVTTQDPEQVRGRHIEPFLPSGDDAMRLRLLMSEIEMWLFQHAVNLARAAQGSVVINGLWLWGGGTTVKTLPTIHGWCVGDDLFFNAIGAGNASSEARVGAGVIVALQEPGGDAWRSGGLRWLEAAALQLRSGRISRLELSAGERCFTVTTRGTRAFWRRRKPWWESFA
ncbi:MAG TPA: hypothetical protein VGI65_01380 [Steroidobacteraceae bacterium]